MTHTCMKNFAWSIIAFRSFLGGAAGAGAGAGAVAIKQWVRTDDLVDAVRELVVLELGGEVRVLLRGRRRPAAITAGRRFDVIRLALDEVGERLRVQK